MAGQGVTYPEFTQLFVHTVSSPAVSSDAFVVLLLECLLEKTLFSLFTLVKPGIWMCQKTELLHGQKYNEFYLLFCVAVVENGIHSKIKAQVLQHQEAVGVRAGSGLVTRREPPTATVVSHEF